jgi:hypothetical protein
MRRHTVILLAASCLLTGCATLEIPKSLQLTKKDLWKGKPAEPAKLVVIWSDAVYNEAGKAPVRGFGGRLFFYDKQSKTVPVEGELVVYGFDDSSEATPAKEPQRKFAFTSEQFRQHFTPGELGASYSVWIPWEPVGGFKKTVSLLPVFTSTTGKVVTGEQTVNSLPGKTPDQAELAMRRRNAAGTREMSAVQPVVYEQTAAGNSGGASAGDLSASNGSQRRMRSSTINLSPNLQRALETSSGAAVPGVAAAAIAGVGSENLSSGKPAAAAFPNGPANNESAANNQATAAMTGNAAASASQYSAVGTDRSSVTGPVPARRQPARFERPRRQVPATTSAQ